MKRSAIAMMCLFLVLSVLLLHGDESTQRQSKVTRVEAVRTTSHDVAVRAVSTNTREFVAESVDEVRPAGPAGPLPERLGEPAVWVVEHLDAWRGWSLTGYSWGGLTEDLHPWRVKVGIISGDLEASDKEHHDTYPNHGSRCDWDGQLKESRPVLGISWCVRF